MQAARWATRLPAVWLLSSLGLAQGEGNHSALTPEQLRALHRRFDVDGDSKASLHEVIAFAQAASKDLASKDAVDLLGQLDTSGDRLVSLSEYLQEFMDQAEMVDHEGMQEVEARIETETAKHSAADLNSDGFLDSEELPAIVLPELHEGVLAEAVAEAMQLQDADKDGRLSNREFFDIDEAAWEERALTTEEYDIFGQLDKDGDDYISPEEFGEWESGRHHRESAMKSLIRIADEDRDTLVSADELAKASEDIFASAAHHHLTSWAEHYEM